MHSVRTSYVSPNLAAAKSMAGNVMLKAGAASSGTAVKSVLTAVSEADAGSCVSGTDSGRLATPLLTSAEQLSEALESAVPPAKRSAPSAVPAAVQASESANGGCSCGQTDGDAGTTASLPVSVSILTVSTSDVTSPHVAVTLTTDPLGATIPRDETLSGALRTLRPFVPKLTRTSLPTSEAAQAPTAMALVADDSCGGDGQLTFVAARMHEGEEPLRSSVGQACLPLSSIPKMREKLGVVAAPEGSPQTLDMGTQLTPVG